MLDKILLFSGVLLFSTSILANDNIYKKPYIGIGTGYSNFGEGLEFTLRLTEKIGVNYSFYNQNESFSIDNYSNSIDILNRSITIDYFPIGNKFYMTGGIVIPDNETEFLLDSSNYNLSSIDSNLSSIKGKAELGNGILPYLGVGFKQNNKEGFGYFAEIGASYLKPSVSISPIYHNDLYSNNSTELAVNNMEEDIYNQINEYKINYIIKAGLYYIF